MLYLSKRKIITLSAIPVLILVCVAAIILSNLTTAPFAKALSITSVSVSKGPADGGTEVTLAGDFYASGPVVSQIYSGLRANCALDTDGKAYCWGWNLNGAFGNGTTTNSSVPVAVDTTGVLAGKTLTQISGGGTTVCALDTDGKAYCWGQGTSGSLGNGTMVNSSVPVAVDMSGVLAGKTLTQISSGGITTCVLDSTGSAYCWGNNYYGVLGNGTTTDSSVPVAVNTSGVLAGKTLAEIVVKYDGVCALDTDGKAYCWGQNTYGRLGNGTTTSSNVPVAVDTTGVLAGKTLTRIAGGGDTVCTLDTDGKAYCWGRNNRGQFGNNSTANSSVPVAVDATGVLAGKSLTQISEWDYTACALDNNGEAYCWGDNDDGQLGNGITGDSHIPVAVDTSGVLAGKTFTQVSVGAISVCALDTDGRVYCWGSNGDGQLGNNSAALSSNIPVRVHTMLDITDTPTVSALPEPTTPPTFVVMFDVGGTPAECINVVVATGGKSLTCTTSAHIAGTVDVTVDDGVSIFTLAGAFEYVNVGVPDTGVRQTPWRVRS